MKKVFLLILAFISYVSNYGQSKVYDAACDCYYNRDCGATTIGKAPEPTTTKTCQNYSYCKGSTTTGGKIRDGICKTKKSKLTLVGDNWQSLIKSTENLFLAFETVAQNGGGYPNLKLIEAAKVGIPHEAFVDLKMTVTRLFIPLTVGLKDYPNTPYLIGNYNLPESNDDDNEDYGKIDQITPELLAVFSTVRQGIIAELSAPDKENFENFIRRIPIIAPNYKTFGRCQYPHPDEHQHEFPFADALDCMYSEIKDGINLILEFKGKREIIKRDTRIISVSPNPASSKVIVEYKTTSANSQLILTNIKDNSIAKEIHLDNVASTIEISLDNLIDGVYSVNLLADGLLADTKKVIVIK